MTVRLLTFAALLLASCPAFADEGAKTKPLTVFLVRHAEKVASDSRDPQLSEAGIARARELARVLGDAELEHIHTTDYVRTRSTATAVAAMTGIEFVTYDPRDLAAFAKELLETGGRHLVVGHSNTTPALVKWLGGEPGDPIEEKTEFDRLYVVTVGPDGEVQTTLLRYGAAVAPQGLAPTPGTR